MNRMTGGTGVRESSNCIDGFVTRALICQPMLRTAPAAALAAGLLAPALLAQGTPADTSAKDTLRRYALPPIVVTASLIPLSAMQVGVATSVLPRADLAAEPTPYLARALTFLPGVSIEGLLVRCSLP